MGVPLPQALLAQGQKASTEETHAVALKALLAQGGKMRKFISGGIEGAEGEEIAPKNFKSQAMPEKAL